MVKHTQAIRRKQSTNCFECIWYLLSIDMCMSSLTFFLVRYYPFKFNVVPHYLCYWPWTNVCSLGHFYFKWRNSNNANNKFFVFVGINVRGFIRFYTFIRNDFRNNGGTEIRKSHGSIMWLCWISYTLTKNCACDHGKVVTLSFVISVI